MHRKSFLYHFTKLFVVLGLLFFSTFEWILLPARIIGDSMYPTLHDREVGLSWIFMKDIAINRFDIVIVERNNELIIKRVVGLPNETIEYKDDNLYVNGEIVEEPFLDTNYRRTVEAKSDGPFTYRFSKVQLKQDEYFVLGDNRPRSQDSRYFGPLKKSEILSKGFFNLYIEK